MPIIGGLCFEISVFQNINPEVNMFGKVVSNTFCIVLLSGCATFKTLDTDIPLSQRMFIYSGTRLNWAAVTENQAALKRMKVTPPRYPIVDLPLSFTLDTFFSPFAACAEIFH